MAAVTQLATAPPYKHVLGDLVCRVFTISGATGSTLSTGQSSVIWVGVQLGTGAGIASTITSFAVNNTTSPGVIVFASSGPMIREVVMVLSRKG